MTKRLGISCNALSLGGGMERYALDLIQELNKRGIRPVVFTKKVDTALIDLLDIELHVCNCGWCPSKIRDYYYSKWLSTKKRIANIDVLIGCNRNLSSDIAVCGGTHKGYITAIRRNRFTDKLVVNLEQKYFKNAQYVVAHSKLMRQELIDYYQVSKERIHVIYPPVNQSTFYSKIKEEKAALREVLGLPKDYTIFLFVSSSHQRKGLPLLIDYFEKTSLPVKLIVVGRPLRSEYKNIISIGFTKEVQKYYWASDFTILASTYEPFGLVGVESVLCGTPVILTDNIGCNEVIKNNAKICFIRNDKNSLEQSISNSLTFDQNIGYSCITEDLSIQTHVDQLLTLTKKIIKKND